jgi:hypothetical protein
VKFFLFALDPSYIVAEARTQVGFSCKYSLGWAGVHK